MDIGGDQLGAEVQRIDLHVEIIVKWSLKFSVAGSDMNLGQAGTIIAIHP